MNGITLERLGNLHLALLHLPVGFVIAIALLEIWRWQRPSAEGLWLQGRLLATNAVASLLTAGAGLLLASSGTYAPGLLAWHRWTGVACAGVAVVAWLLHAYREKRGDALAARRSGQVALVVLLATTLVAGHFGATLTHGPGITEFWVTADKSPSSGPPANSTNLVATPTKVVAAGVVVRTPAEQVFLQKIQPVLERSCLECHGSKKSKGKLRLDSRDAALAGGKSGEPTLVPGKPAQSEWVRRVKLPRTDDEAMPSGDDPGLSAAEISALEHWIADGAIWPK